MASHLVVTHHRLSNGVGSSSSMRSFSLVSRTSLGKLSANKLYAPDDPPVAVVVAGSCHGLLCLQYHNGRFVLWNPSTEEFKLLPPFPSLFGSCTLPLCETSKCTRTIEFHSVSIFMDCLYKAALYSLRNDTWNEIPCPGPYDIIDGIGTCVNESCYWLATDIIVSFNFTFHTFSRITYPRLLKWGLLGKKAVLPLYMSGVLGLVIYPRFGNPKFFSFWVRDMEYGSWTRKAELDVRLFGVKSPLGFGLCRNGTSFLFKGMDGEVLEYAYNIRELKKVNELYDYQATIDHIFPYSENISVQLNGKIAVLNTLENIKRMKMVDKEEDKLRAVSPPTCCMPIFLRCERGSCFYKVWAYEGSLRATTLHTPFSERKHKVVGYCDGLFCFEYDDGEILLWNPSKNEYQILPASRTGLKPPICPYPSCDGNCTVQVILRVCGLGLDPKSGDHKVLRLVGNYYDHDKEYTHGCINQAEVYSLVNDCWNEISAQGCLKKHAALHLFDIGDLWEEMEAEAEIECDMMDECATYADGFCYWIGQGEDEAVAIVSFDFSNETFSTLGLPVTYNIHEADFVLMNFKRLLGLVVYKREDKFKVLHPWVWTKNEWTPNMGLEVTVEAERPLGYCGGELLLLEGYDSMLLAYDLDQQTLSKTDKIKDYPRSLKLFPYGESTITLKSPIPNLENRYVENVVLQFNKISPVPGQSVRGRENTPVSCG
ncbi:hypothetical protein OROHE_012254 [Orobanche hederae]